MTSTSASRRRRRAPRERSADDFARWYEQHAPWLKKSCTSWLGDPSAAEDVVHESLLRAWIHRDEFESDAHVGPWLHRVARNLCVDAFRDRSRWMLGALHVDASPHAPDPAAAVEAKLHWQKVVEAISALDPQQRRALLMRAVDERRYVDVAADLGVGEVTARTIVHRARRALTDTLRRSGELPATIGVGLHGLWRAAASAASGAATVAREPAARRAGAAAASAAMAAVGLLAGAPAERADLGDARVPTPVRARTVHQTSPIDTAPAPVQRSSRPKDVATPKADAPRDRPTSPGAIRIGLAAGSRGRSADHRALRVELPVALTTSVLELEVAGIRILPLLGAN